MDDETRTAFETLRAESQEGFRRMERFFELGQARHLDLRADVARLDEKVAGLTARITALEESLRAFRDWVTLQFSELRAAIGQLTVRVDRLERLNR